MAGNKKQRVRIDRNKNPLHRFSALNRLMGAQIANEPMTDADAGELEIAVLTSLDAVTRGHGTTREWDSLARCINQSWTLANKGIGAEMIPLLIEAQEAMRRVAKRFRETGKVAFDGEGLQTVREAISTWGAQIRLCTVGEIYAATNVVAKHYRGVQA